MNKTCPLCNQNIKNGEWVTAILAARFLQKEAAYDLEVSRQAILSHISCPPVSVSEAPKA